MGVKAFTFKSPGIFLNEIDQSQLAQEPAPVGPIIVGRAQRGPAMRPVTVSSYEEFVQTFGEPVAGNDSSGDVWRSGIPSGPTYGSYAAQAWLANNPTVTFVRLLGTQTDNPTVTTSNNNGYAGWTVGDPTSAAAKGAYGLFVFPSSSIVGTLVGSLAAVWYCSGSVPVLSGSVYGKASTVVTQSNGIAIISDANGVFTVNVSGTSGQGVDTNLNKSFDFSPTSDKFIRKVFNTNPQNTNRDTTSGPGTSNSSFYGYWLGETFENDIAYNVSSGSIYPLTGSVTTRSVGIILPVALQSRLNYPASENNAARTGWIIGQGSSGVVANFSASSQKKLFRFIALDAGDWIRGNLKITINNILAPQNDAQKFGTFDVEIRKIYDTDANKMLVESFTNCTLDPDSPNYIARKIGDTYYSWDETNRNLTSVGENPSRSRFVRVQMANDYTPIAGDIPFGVLGPLRYLTIPTTQSFDGLNSWIYGTSSADCFAAAITTNFTGSGVPNAAQTFTFTYPASRARVSSSEDGLTTYKLADWGATTTRSPGSILYNEGINDILRLPLLSAASTNFTDGTEGNGLTYAWTFSLDDVRVTGSTLSGGTTWQNKYFIWTAGSKATSGINGSFTAVSGTFAELLNTQGINSFTTTFQGGIDGFNVMEGEPLRNNAMSSATDQNSYIYYTYKRAIDTVRDPEVVEGNLFTIPGLAYEPLTSYAIQMAESRADVLAVIDASKDTNTATYITKQEKSDSTQGTTSRVATIDQVVDRMKQRNLNSSYGATYYPWVQIADSNTGKTVTVPPSIVAVGAMSYTDAVQAPWFAPAGFNRGGLSTGNAGLNVINVVKKLSQADRDKLYPVNINPIASFPNEGIVIFGQKTLQAVPSALDRINVRRLMLYIKRGINLISKQILFEPNVENTWNNFKDKADPFLSDVKARFGLTDYKLILDKTTTTPDLIDQNIMYAKIYLKPARAIEFIAIDFFITKTGAQFPV